MASSKQQTVIEAPVEAVWKLLVDPGSYTRWNEEVTEVTGGPTTIEKGSTFELTGAAPLGQTSTTTFKVEELDSELHEIKMRCQLSGFYSHWKLTDVRGDTFADVELGIEPLPDPSAQGRMAAALHTKRYLRRALDRTIDSLRRAVSRAPSRP